MPTDLAKLRAFATEIRELIESACALTFVSTRVAATRDQATDQLAEVVAFLEAFISRESN